MSLVASLVLGLLGMYFLMNGKKTQNTNKMLLGAALILAGYLVFG